MSRTARIDRVDVVESYSILFTIEFERIDFYLPQDDLCGIALKDLMAIIHNQNSSRPSGCVCCLDCASVQRVLRLFSVKLLITSSEVAPA